MRMVGHALRHLSRTSLGLLVVLALATAGAQGAATAAEPPASPAGESPAAETPPPAPAPEPEPDATQAEPDAPEPPSGPESDLDPAELQRIRDQARDLRDQLFKARARVSLVAAKLFQSRITLELRSNLERFYEVSDLTVTLDGAPVYTRDKGLAPTAAPLFEYFAAPGSHQLGVSANLVSRRDRTYRITLNQTFSLAVPEDTTVSSRLILRETGNMWRFAKRQRGAYRLRVVLRAKAKPNQRGRKRIAPAPKAGGSVKASGGVKAGGKPK